MYYDHKRPTTPHNILPMEDNVINNASIPSLTDVALDVFKYAPMTTTFSALPPPLTTPYISNLFTVTPQPPQPQP